MRRTPIYGLLLASVLFVACDSDDSGGLSFTQAVSECGGFAAQQKDHIPSPGDYCAQELLLWQYDAATHTLDLSNNRVSLNCCGVHTIDITIELGVMIVTENDAPGSARCHCMCVYDYTAQVAYVPADDAGDPLSMRIVRNVTDSEDGPVTVWEGAIDLLDGSGMEVVDASLLDYGCNEAQ
jgi:hypothetical protein